MFLLVEDRYRGSEMEVWDTLDQSFETLKMKGSWAKEYRLPLETGKDKTIVSSLGHLGRNDALLTAWF